MAMSQRAYDRIEAQAARMLARAYRRRGKKIDWMGHDTIVITVRNARGKREDVCIRVSAG